MSFNLDYKPCPKRNGSAAGDDEADRGETPKMPWNKHQYARAPAGTRDRDLAKKCFEDALEVMPTDSFTWHKLGLLYEEEYADRDAAVRCFERAVECNPKNAPALNSLGLACKAKDPQQALHFFTRCIDCSPEYGRAHKNLGLLYLNELQDHPRARQSFLECIRVDPNNASAYVSMGQLFERQKEWTAAEQYYRMGIECDPRNPMGYFRLGVLFQTQKKLVESRQYFERAVRAAPTDQRICTKLAKLLEELKEHVEARKLYRTALHYNPDESWLAGRIRYIEQRFIPKNEEGHLVLTDNDNAILIEHREDFERAPSDGGAPPNRGVCPRNHSLICIFAKPPTYRPQATWACEECHKSIGGLDLKMNGAYHCSVCKYDLCSLCSGKPRKAHETRLDEPRFLGKGSFGAVYREFDHVTHEYVAVKHINTPTERVLNDVRREVKIMRQFEKSPYIVRVLRADFDRHPTPVARVYLELMDGSVAALLEQHGPVHETQARVWIHNAACGLATLHTFRQQVLHRDIKPENLLLKDNKVKLSDFGLSKSIDGSMVGGTTGGPKGTPQYIAPEIFESNQPDYTYAADIWSLACTWIAMVTGRAPWHGVIASDAGIPQLCWEMLHKRSPPIPPFLSQGARELLGRMLAMDRRIRPTAEMILADPYFRPTYRFDDGESEEVYEGRRNRIVEDRRSRELSDGAINSSGVMDAAAAFMTPTTGMPNCIGHFPAIDAGAIVSALPPKGSSFVDVSSPRSPGGFSVCTTASLSRICTTSSVNEGLDFPAQRKSANDLTKVTAGGGGSAMATGSLLTSAGMVPTLSTGSSSTKTTSRRYAPKAPVNFRTVLASSSNVIGPALASPPPQEVPDGECSPSSTGPAGTSRRATANGKKVPDAAVVNMPATSPPTKDCGPFAEAGTAKSQTAAGPREVAVPPAQANPRWARRACYTVLLFCAGAASMAALGNDEER